MRNIDDVAEFLQQAGFEEASKAVDCEFADEIDADGWVTAEIEPDKMCEIYLCTFRRKKDGYLLVSTCWYIYPSWGSYNAEDYEIIAWREMPEPYHGGDKK